MDFPLLDLLDEGACYDFLVDALHPAGLRCPICGSRRYTVHRAHREPVLDYRCGCGRVFNAWTGTAFQGTQRTAAALVVLVRGIAQGTPTAQLARELGCDRKELLALRYRLQERARIGLDRNPLGDEVVEADEMYQNAGEKRHPARRPRRPAAAARQQPEGPWHLRDGPTAGRRCGRARVGGGPAGRDRDGQHGRVG